MRILCAILTVAVVIGLGSKARAAQPELADGIDAIVHDTIITFQTVDNATTPIADELRRQYYGQPEVYDKKLTEALKENLDRLMENKLILHEFDTAGKYNLPESIVDDALQERIRNRYGDRITLMRTLQAEGMTYEQFRKQFRENFIVEQMRYSNISSERIVVSPHKIEMYYVDHKSEFKVEDQVKLRMIVLNKPAGSDAAQTRKLAEEILGKINDGATFEEMASVYSQGSQRSQGGDWGWVEKSVLRKELADVAFNTLKPSGKSGVIDTPEACYLMRVEDARPEHIKSLPEVRDEIEKTLLAQERARLQKQWIDKLRKKTFVRTFS
jgi:parvulin-like peptidyl-prolyl isomerase